MDLLVPKLSATMETVKVLRWLKQVGDKVAMGAPLVELETDKATMEVESPAEGTLEAVLGAEGEELSVGALLARLRIAGESATPSEMKSTAASVAVAACARGGPRRRGVSVLDRGPRVADPRFPLREAPRENEWD